MRKSVTGDDDHKLWWLLTYARRALYKLRSRELFQYGITPEEATVLFIVKAIGRKATPAEISRWTLRESHSISGLLMRMEKKGLINKVKDLDKKNLVRIVITRKGQKAYLNSTKREIIHKVLNYLTKEDRNQLRILLEKIRAGAFNEGAMDRIPPFPNFD